MLNCVYEGHGDSEERERHLVLVDIENLAATSKGRGDWLRPSPADRRLQPPQLPCRRNANASVAQRVWGSGLNGADLALLGVLDNERVDDRFGHVTICSGDGIFAVSAARLGGAGVDVTVVSLKGHLAARLELAARYVRVLTPPAERVSRSVS
jgi:hypothetical protein